MVEQLITLGIKHVFETRAPHDRGIRSPDPLPSPNKHAIRDLNAFLRDLVKEGKNNLDALLERNGKSIYRLEEGPSRGTMDRVMGRGLNKHKTFSDYLGQASLDHVETQIQREDVIFADERQDMNATKKQLAETGDYTRDIGGLSNPKTRKEERRLEQLAFKQDQIRAKATPEQRRRMDIEAFNAKQTGEYPPKVRLFAKKFFRSSPDEQIRMLAQNETQSLLVDLFNMRDFNKVLAKTLQQDAIVRFNQSDMRRAHNPILRGLMTFMFEKRDNPAMSAEDTLLLHLFREVGMGAFNQLSDIGISHMDLQAEIALITKYFDANISAKEFEEDLWKFQNKLADVVRYSLDRIIQIAWDLDDPPTSASILMERVQNQLGDYPKDRAYPRAEVVQVMIDTLVYWASAGVRPPSSEQVAFWELLSPR